MKGLSRISVFGLALLVSTLAVAENTGPSAKSTEEGGWGFFSRLFGSDDSDKAAARVSTSRLAPVESKAPAASQAVSHPVEEDALAQREPESKTIPAAPQAVSHPVKEDALAAKSEPESKTAPAPLAKASAPTPLASSSEETHRILKQADESRGNLQGISWNVEIESKERGHIDSMLYDIKARGFNISGINIAPPKSKGQKLLMLDNNMWFHKPNLSKPIPISLRQKLMGQASYGDIASTNYADDYEATRLPDEIVDGVDCYVFDLKARDSKTTYDRIMYWVDKKRLVGIKADYYTLSGKRFKSSDMQYGSTVMINGKERPFISQIDIYEELMSGDVTTLSMTKPKLSPLPDYIFNINLFMR